MYGCYDQYMGMAIAEYGTAVVEKLHERCLFERKGSLYGCEHPIGHGLIGYFGYSLEALMEALALCDSFAPDASCADGAFMEYNVRAMAVSDEGAPRQSAVRKLDESKPYEPCSLFEGRNRSICFFELPWWWHHVWEHEKSSEDIFGKLGALCAGLAEGKEKDMCFEGIGFYAPQVATLDPAVSRSFCRIAASGGRANLLCLSSAALRLGVEGEGSAATFCKLFGLEGEELSSCSAYRNSELITVESAQSLAENSSRL
jgi:hypothetical protein